MDARELRIGNLLDSAQGAVTVSAIRNKDQVEIEETGSYFTVSGDKPCLPALKLTEDILLDFGFEVDESYDDVEKVYILPHPVESDTYIVKDKGVFHYGLGYQDFQKEMLYVHTLQNYHYALKNIELKLQNK